jgi:hypothetical protein
VSNEQELYNTDAVYDYTVEPASDDERERVEKRVAEYYENPDSLTPMSDVKWD